MTLESLRNNIDALDDQLLTLLNQRMELVRQVGELKRSTNAVIYRPEREKQIIDRLHEKNLSIAAEAEIPVHFTFATKAENLADITHVYSKDIAFRQCSRFLHDSFDGFKAEFVPVESTSKAAKMAAQNPNAAALCSSI